MALGLILSRAGAASEGFREGEESARKARERQLQVEQQNRLDQMRKEQLGAQLPTAPQYQRMAMPQLGVEQVAPKEEATTATPPAPTPAKVWEPDWRLDQDRLKQQIRDRLVTPQMQDWENRRARALARGFPEPPKPAVNEATVEKEYARIIEEARAMGQRGPSTRSSGAMRRRRTAAGVAPPSGAAPAAGGELTPDAALAASMQGAPTSDFEQLASTVERIESGGRPYAVNPKSGASGSMQTMKETLRDPGYGVTPAQDDSALEKRRVGRDYLAAMLREFGGNKEHALVAYNWGPANAQRWIAQGADVSKLPAETQDYLVKAGVRSGEILAQAPAGVRPATVAQAAQPGQFQPYMGGEEQSIPMEFQRMTQARDELAQLAAMYQRSGMGSEFMQVRSQILALDNNMTYMQGMQGLRELETYNDPRRLAAVWSMYEGRPINIQPRSDGTYNILANGQVVKPGVSADQLANSARLAFDTGYRQQQAAASAEYGMKSFEANLEMMKNRDLETAKMISKLAEEAAKGNAARALEYAKANYNWEIKPVGSEGMVIIRPPGQSPFIFTPEGQAVTIDGIEVQSTAARPIAGLPNYAPPTAPVG